MTQLRLENPNNPNEIFVTEIRNNTEVKYRELKSSFIEMVGDEEVETITLRRKFLTSISE